MIMATTCWTRTRCQLQARCFGGSVVTLTVAPQDRHLVPLRTAASQSPDLKGFKQLSTIVSHDSVDRNVDRASSEELAPAS